MVITIFWGFCGWPQYPYNHIRKTSPTHQYGATTFERSKCKNDFQQMCILHQNTNRNYGFYNCHLKLKFNCMWHIELQIHVVA